MSNNPDFRKITFNAHEATCQWFESRYGYGWTERVRDLMDRHMTDTNRSESEATAYARSCRTLGDLPND